MFEELVQHGPLPAGRVAHLFAQAADAIGEAHDLGLVHRDIKPANLMVCRRGGIPDLVKVLDFGLAMRVEDLDSEEGQGVMGTPLYLAPEVITGKSGTASDIYAFGAAIYHCLTGSAPFRSRDVSELYARHLREDVERPSTRLGREVPEALESLVLRTLAKEPAERPTIQELAAELTQIARSLGWDRERSRAWWDREAAALRESLPDPDPLERERLTVDLGRRRGDRGSRA